jgi:hypothetical protein
MHTGWIVIVLMAVVLAMVVSCRTSGANVAVAMEKIKQGALVIDVRTAAEYAGGLANLGM